MGKSSRGQLLGRGAIMEGAIFFRGNGPRNKSADYFCREASPKVFDRFQNASANN